MLDDAARSQIVRQARLAPSVHNTQPARWCFDADGSITILADESRFLTVGDPEGRDAALSCGAAVEGTVMALADLDLAATVEDLWQPGPQRNGLRPAARIAVRSGGAGDPLSALTEARFTWRARFGAATDRMKKGLAEWASGHDDVTLATAPRDMQMLARLNDEASLRFYRRDDYREELVYWMRLTRSHPDYARDGLNLDALQLGALEGQIAKIALGTDLYRVLDGLGLSGALLGERAKTLSSTAIVLFHRPRDESALETGRVFYRLWLHLARLGFSAWPMAVLADDPDAASACSSHFAISEDRRLINVFRVGLARGTVPRARHPAEDLIVPNG